ncbi:class I SAM-dependent methyltransferase [Cytophagaceae bacterium DM2B3-1]|uniref:Class I SAM-dependent methyltransferase n=2 Tax=Xanthocytophaga TaxID=3078918 RepID=A0ABT7CZE5_9BACT|nr:MULTISPECIES: class I SAM-dependent methyltransferase [Xanthocytophaga]MDJ1470694.1 class I SAM-dependent methyltransferase [Xanthocytophaga flavus]MDJ1498277.1 class I SAM-dependent methyltransferase [Xanthocytophaga flavus]MDJ1505278.1 class I SAM-dependent methyltransferase [Xanthocytophaga agilis]
MREFWEEAFKDKQEMWGFDPTHSALLTAEMFVDKGVKKVLIPGIGYGRNAQAFLIKTMEVTGIEISKTAIELAEKHFGSTMKIYHGSVTDMPFDSDRYEGIFSHALIHLLDENERTKFIKDCYKQLSDSGYMVFTAISKKAHSYGQGTYLSKDRYEQFGGVKIFFYDETSVQKEFGKYGLTHITEVTENHPFYLITCFKRVP